MRLKKVFCCGAAAVALASVPANAATIALIDQGFAGTPAQQQAFRNGFQIAANYWGSILSNNVTIRLGVGTAALGTGIIGSTGSTRIDYSAAAWEAGVNLTKSNSAIDTNIVLPTLTATSAAPVPHNPVPPALPAAPVATPGISFISNGVTGAIDDTRTLRYIRDSTVASRLLYLNTSVVKAIGGVPTYGSDAQMLDGQVQFSTNFNFDFNPTDGISANTFDFIGVAIHEIGHALGFVSGVDFFDVYGIRTNGGAPGGGSLGYSLNDTSSFSALDMFRYSADPTNVAPGAGASLDLSAGTVSGTKYFSIDGGVTALFGNSFSQGRFNGDGQQASHWKDNLGLGILDPTFSFSEMGAVTGLDLAAFDAMGWNLSTNALTYGRVTTSSIFNQFAATVPEPTTWAMMIGGFGLIGGTLRRRVRVTKVGYAA